jgi:hypothetical protein
MTIGKKPYPTAAKAAGEKPKRLGKVRLGMGGLSQAAIDRVHVLVNIMRAAKGKGPIDFNQPANKPRSWRSGTQKFRIEVVQTNSTDRYASAGAPMATEEQEVTQ